MPGLSDALAAMGGIVASRGQFHRRCPSRYGEGGQVAGVSQYRLVAEPFPVP